MNNAGMNRIQQLGLGLSFTVMAAFTCAQEYKVPAGTPDYIRQAVESTQRPEAAVARDSNRKPAEVLTLSGIKPGDRVAEFAGFGQYYTYMLSDIVGSSGSVTMYDLPYTEARNGDNSRAFVASHPNTSYVVKDYNELSLPADIDVVYNVLYYHDLPLNNIDTASLNKKIFDALKPGGVYLLVDHNAAPGSGTRDTQQLHRIDPEVIAEEIQSAGFKLVERSNLLAHPEDDHSKMVFDPQLRGQTDRTVFKFQKPE